MTHRVGRLAVHAPDVRPTAAPATGLGGSALAGDGLLAAAGDGVLPVVPAVALGDAVLPAVAVGAGSAGEVVEAAADGAGALSGVAVAAGAADGAGADDAAGDDAPPADAPPAAFSNSVRCARNSTSLARIAGSMPVVPEVPTAPGVPLGGAAGAAGAALPSPTSAVRFACTLAVRRAPFSVRGDQLVEVRDQLRHLGARIAGELRGRRQLGQLAEAVAGRRQVTLDALGVDRLRGLRGLSLRRRRSTG